MVISEENRSFVARLNEFSGGGLSHPEDLGLLLELGMGKASGRLDRLVFLAKFVSGTYRIMNRIGKDGEGYDKLSSEFSQALEEIMELLRALTEPLADSERSRFARLYLAMKHETLASLMSLLSDLAWYKNWQIDNRKRIP